MLIVDSAKGTPNFSAARAAWISPSGWKMPASPAGPSATGIATGRPSIVERICRPSRSTATRWRSPIAASRSVLAR